MHLFFFLGGGGPDPIEVLGQHGEIGCEACSVVRACVRVILSGIQCAVIASARTNHEFTRKSIGQSTASGRQRVSQSQSQRARAREPEPESQSQRARARAREPEPEPERERERERDVKFTGANVTDVDQRSHCFSIAD